MSGTERKRDKERKRERVRFSVTLILNVGSFSCYIFRILCSLVLLFLYGDSLYEEAMTHTNTHDFNI